MYQQQHLLNQFYLSNGYQQNINPLTYQRYAQVSQLMSQSMQQNMNQNNMANNLQNMGNDMNTQQMQEQFLNNLAFIQMMNQGAGLGGDMSNMNNLGMMNNNENNQDSQ
jgi:hypothetical protein